MRVATRAESVAQELSGLLRENEYSIISHEGDPTLKGDKQGHPLDFRVEVAMMDSGTRLEVGLFMQYQLPERIWIGHDAYLMHQKLFPKEDQMRLLKGRHPQVKMETNQSRGYRLDNTTGYISVSGTLSIPEKYPPFNSASFIMSVVEYISDILAAGGSAYGRMKELGQL